MRGAAQSPVCERCFRQWDFVPDTSLPYSGALKAVHPVGPCVERKSLVADPPEPPPRKPQASIEYDPRYCDICRKRYTPRQCNQITCSPQCRSARDNARRQDSRKPDWFKELEQTFPTWCKKHRIALTIENTHSRGRKQRVCKLCNLEHQRAVKAKRRKRTPQRERTRIEVGKYAA